MLVRYFGAARAATRLDQEEVDVKDGTTLNDLLVKLVQRYPAADDGPPSLSSVILRSSFLRNEVSLRDHTAALNADDVIDVLPPFAGG